MFSFRFILLSRQVQRVALLCADQPNSNYLTRSHDYANTARNLTSVATIYIYNITKKEAKVAVLE